MCYYLRNNQPQWIFLFPINNNQAAYHCYLLEAPSNWNWIVICIKFIRTERVGNTPRSPLPELI